MVNQLTQNQWAVVVVPPTTMSANFLVELDLLSQINSEKTWFQTMLDQPYPVSWLRWKNYTGWRNPVKWWPKLQRGWKFQAAEISQKSLNWMRKLQITRKFFPTTNGQTFRNQEVWKPLQHCKCLTFVSLGIDHMIVLGKVSQLISAERKDKLKHSLNVDIKFVTTTIQHLIIWRKHRKA